MPATWGDITAEEILAPTNGALVSGGQQTVFSGISTDSRSTKPGELFWALVGERFDGHDFAQTALDRGAAGVVAQKGRSLQISRPNDPTVIEVDDSLKAFGDLAGWWRHQHDTRVIAITGSAGKTTTKEMAAGILKIGCPTLVTQGNFNNLIGLPITLLRLEKEHRNTVLEMGMNRPGEISRLTEIADPDVGVITNVGMAHLEGLGDIKGVARAKVELVGKISPGGRVILNGDDKLLMKTAAVYQKNAVTFGLGEHNDIRGTDLRNLGQEGSSFHLRYGGGSLAVKLNIPGIQNVLNALAAAAVCLSLHEPPEHIVEGLHGFTGVNGRFTLVNLGDVSLVDDTYNANPSSLKAALESVGALVNKGGRIIVGLGEMMELGDAATKAHREAGRMVGALEVKRFLAMGEHAREMVEGALESGMHRDKAATVKTHDEMVEIIGNEMQQGDLIFLKGSRKTDLGKVVDSLKNRCR
jgi:UDP-N-acetylmuramoyl-tripeptide--D-alanyl-D-alanine ligase